MTDRPFDLGLCAEDERAMKDARGARTPIDADSALRLMANASSIVDAAVRRRPPLAGAPFVLPARRTS
jgi:hypothetical protein